MIHLHRSISSSILLLLLVGASAVAQTVLWNRKYGGKSVEVSVTAISTFDGGYIIGGTSASYPADSGMSHGAYLVKTDRDGVAEWSRSVPSGRNGMIRFIAQAPDSTYMIVVGSAVGGVYPGLFIAKLDPRGEIIWTRELGREDDPGMVMGNVYTATRTRDGGLFVVGNTGYRDVGWFTREGHLAAGRYDGEGRLLWMREYERMIADSVIDLVKRDTSVSFFKFGDVAPDYRIEDYPAAVIETSDGGFIVAGRIQAGWLPSPTSFLLRIAGDGAPRWSRTYGDELALAFFAQDVVETSDGGFLLLAHQLRATWGYVSLIMKIDGEGEIITHETHGPSDTSYTVFPRSIGRIDGDRYVACGESRFANHSFIHLAWYDDDGTLLDTSDIDAGISFRTIHECIPGKDGSLIILGDAIISRERTNWDFCLVKIIPKKLTPEE